MDLAKHFWRYVGKAEAGCWVWVGAKLASGYGVFNAHRKTLLVHRYAHELQKGPIPKGWVVRHSCGEKACVHPGHLFCAAGPDRSRQKPWHGHGKKLTLQDAKKIRALKRKLPVEEIALLFGITKGMVYHILSGRSWKPPRSIPGYTDTELVPVPLSETRKKGELTARDFTPCQEAGCEDPACSGNHQVLIAP